MIRQKIFVILDRVIRYHGILISIISDRNKISISKFYQTLLGKIGMKEKILMVYYPQTDK